MRDTGRSTADCGGRAVDPYVVSSSSMPHRRAAATLLLAAAACSTSDPAKPAPDASTPRDASTDASDSTDGGVDASLPRTSPCGDTSGFPSGDGWFMPGGCAKRPGRSANLRGPENQTLRWKYPAVTAGGTPAVMPDGSVYVATKDLRILALSDRGVPLHDAGPSLATLSAEPSSPVLTKSGVLVGGLDGSLSLFSLDGLPGPRYAMGPIRSSPAVAGKRVVATDTHGVLHALALAAAAAAFTVRTEDTGGSSPAIGDGGAIYAGSTNGKLYAFGADGAPRWTFDAGAKITGSPAVSDLQTICFGAEDGTMFVVGEDGKERTRLKTGGAVRASCAFGKDGTCYCGSADGKLHALAPTGKETFAFTTLGAVGAPVVGSEGAIYFGSEDTKFYSVNPKGELLWAVSAGSPVRAQAAIAPGRRLYFTSETQLLAIGD